MNAVIALTLCLSFATGAAAANYVKDLKSKDDAKVVAAAEALAGRGMAVGLSREELEALTKVAMDAKPAVAAAAADALAANHDVALSAEYAEKYEKETIYFAAFLLWYSIYNTYAGLAEIEGDEIGGGVFDEMNRAAERAEKAYGNILDSERKTLAESYYRNLRL